jgi:Amt family ammonium transporter
MGRLALQLLWERQPASRFVFGLPVRRGRRANPSLMEIMYLSQPPGRRGWSGLRAKEVPLRRLLSLLTIAFLLIAVMPALADTPLTVEALKADMDAQAEKTQVMADTLWVMIAGFLVFFMNLGFATVESGFCRAKNCVNILAKNFVVFAVASLAFYLFGFGLMFGSGPEPTGPFVGSEGVFRVGGPDNSPKKITLASLIKDDIKSKYDLDLSDEEVAKSHEELIGKIDALSDEARTTITSNKTTKMVDGKEEEVAVTFPVALEIPTAKGPEKFEASYEAQSFYWGAYSSISWATVPLWAKFFFQLVFAGTAATIVSGAVAERVKYKSFILFSFLLTALIYPVVGHMIWGGGWLAAKGMWDFAGSTVVHSVGGWAALAGAIVLGARLGKYGADGKVRAIPGHNLTAATIGCFILWLGWFGFNPGSTMAADGSAIARIAVMTNFGAMAGILSATALAWILLGKPDLGMTLNGCLAGLVAITAPCAWVDAPSAILIGLIAGALVVVSVMLFDRIKVDDPVGAISVHLVNGIWGTLAVGLFGLAEYGLPHDGLLKGGGMDGFLPQLIGVAVAGAIVFPASLAGWLVLKYTLGIRVEAEEEIQGLDIGEHGNEAYYGFVMAQESLTSSIEPKAASVPPDGAKRFKVVVDGVAPADLVETWSGFCQPSKTPAPQFKAVYPNMTLLEGNRFHFRGGDPKQMSENLRTLLQSRMEKKPIKVYVEA